MKKQRRKPFIIVTFYISTSKVISSVKISRITTDYMEVVRCNYRVDDEGDIIRGITSRDDAGSEARYYVRCERFPSRLYITCFPSPISPKERLLFQVEDLLGERINENVVTDIWEISELRKINGSYEYTKIEKIYEDGTWRTHKQT